MHTRTFRPALCICIIYTAKCRWRAVVYIGLFGGPPLSAFVFGQILMSLRLYRGAKSINQDPQKRRFQADLDWLEAPSTGNIHIFDIFFDTFDVMKVKDRRR